MNSYTHADRMHRLVKEALDRGTAGTVEEAEAMFKRYRIVLEISASDAALEIHQATLLTVVALARRVFLGGVYLRMNGNALRKVPLPLAADMRQAAEQLGARVCEMPELGGDTPIIVIGGAQRSRAGGFEVRTLVSGWRGGVVPIDSPHTGNDEAIPLAGMLAAGLAISEAFLHVREENATAGRRSMGLSLWDPRSSCDWLDTTAAEPALEVLPSRLWLLGLGHLGQAYLWALGLLSFEDPHAVDLVLQDVDLVTPSTESTSVLTDADMIGRKKTREMASWAERRGFTTSIHERRFAAGFHRQPEEPSILLCGLDNAMGRRAMDNAGFDFIVEAGLGRGYRDFRALRLHTLPGSRAAAQLWPRDSIASPSDVPPAYQKLLSDGLVDRCGMTLLAGKAVGAPFVGAVAACLVVSEVLRLLHGGPIMQVIDLDLQWPEHREAALQSMDFRHLNPGYQRVA